MHPDARTYRVRVIGLAASVAVGLSLLADLLLSGWPLAGRLLAERAMREEDPGVLDAAALGEGLLGLVYLVSLVAAAVLVIIWTYRARVNLDAFPGAAPGLHRAWAIAGWLVPVANLVVPFRVLGAIVRSSLAKLGTPVQVWLWFLAWLGYLLGGQVITRADAREWNALPAVLIDEADYQAYVDYYGDALLPNLVVLALGVVAGATLIVLIGRTSRAQERRIDRGARVVLPGSTVPVA